MDEYEIILITAKPLEPDDAERIRAELRPIFDAVLKLPPSDWPYVIDETVTAK